MIAETRQENHNALIFKHQGNAQVAASVTLAGMVAVLLGGVFMAIGAPVKQGPGPARGSIGGAPATVRVIGVTPRADTACEQQVWPNIDQRCLVRTEATTETKATATADAKAKVAAKPPAVPDDKLSPLTAASVNHPSPPQDATSGAAPQAATQPPPVRQSARNETAAPDETVGGFRREFRTDDVDDPDDAADLPPERPIEPPRGRAQQHILRIPFHVHFGGFRF